MLEKRVYPYETLIRLRPGGYEAAHVIELEEIVDDGVVITARELPARTIDMAGEEFGTIIGLINQAAFAEAEGLRLAQAASVARIAELESQLAALRSVA